MSTLASLILQLVSFILLLQIELAKVKQQKIPSGWAADSTGKVSMCLVTHLVNLLDIAAVFLSITCY